MKARAGWMAWIGGVTTVLLVGLACSDAAAQMRGMGGPRRMRPPEEKPRPRLEEHYSILIRPPHRGQLVDVGACYAEVVTRTWEVRVYLFDRAEQPLSTQGMHGQVNMFLLNVPQPVTGVLEYVPQPKDSQEQDYLATVIDATRLPGTPLQVCFRLGNPPVGNLRELTFNIPFALSPVITPSIAVALTEADAAGIARQRFCPVTGLELGSRGTPVKMLVGQQVVYLCYRGCIPQFETHPDSFLARLTTAGFNVSPQAANPPMPGGQSVVR